MTPRDVIEHAIKSRPWYGSPHTKVSPSDVATDVLADLEKEGFVVVHREELCGKQSFLTRLLG